MSLTLYICAVKCGSSDKVSRPCAIVAPNGPFTARSGSTWIHWWSSVASANRLTRSCVTSSQSVGPSWLPWAAANSSSPLNFFTTSLLHRLEDDRLVAISDDAVLTVPQHRPRQNKAFDIRAEPRKIVDAVSVVYPHYVLLDDRPLVQVLGDVMRCRADEFHASFLRPPIRRGPDEGGQK